MNSVKSGIKRELLSRHLLITMALLLVATGILWRGRMWRDYYNGGDQSFYFLMTQSLINDGDLNVANNVKNKDFAPYYPGILDETTTVGQVGKDQAGTDKQYTIHGVGLSFLLVPGFLIAGARGAEFEMVLLSVVTLYLSYRWSLKVTNNVLVSLLASGALLASYFFAGLAGYIYPDIITAGLILGMLLFLSKKKISTMDQIWLGLLAGASVFVHFRSLVMIASVGAILIYKFWLNNRRLPYAFFLVSLLLALIFEYTTYSWFSTLNPMDIYADVGINTRTFVGHALLLDSTRGLIINNPIFILLFVGFPLWLRKNKESFLLTLTLLLPSVAILFVFSGWHGGDAPIGRYITNYLPTSLPALAYVFMYAKQLWQRVVVAGLFAVTMLFTYYFMREMRYWLGVDNSPIFHKLPGSEYLHKLVPAFDANATVLGRYGWLQVLGWSVILATLFMYGRALTSKQK